MSTRWVRCEPVLHRRALGETTVMAPDGDEPVTLVPPADQVWALLATPHSADELVAALAGDVDAEVVREAITALLPRLAQHGLVRAATAS